jgi:GNAT superfamily N-acetyltransferase
VRGPELACHGAAGVTVRWRMLPPRFAEVPMLAALKNHPNEERDATCPEDEMHIRNITPDDYVPIIEVVDHWWGGRPMAAMLPKLFFVHFRETSFVAEVNGDLVGFLVGFLSPALTDEAYIHFVGVHPEHRNLGVGRALYERFFDSARSAGRHYVRCVTSPANSVSIAFHRSMGFQLRERTEDGRQLSVYPDYDGPGENRVLLAKEI